MENDILDVTSGFSRSGVSYNLDQPGAPPAIDWNPYPPLEGRTQIRLLELHPGNPGDTMKTTLVTKDLRDKPSYEAVSYVWGSYRGFPSILLHDHIYDIPMNLFDALESLRTSETTRVLWVDALCINQPDLKEKEHQIPLMGEIYKTAASVVVYLGQPTEQTETDMQHLRSFLQPHIRGGAAPWAHIAIPDFERSISNILDRPWFERMWTVQEGVLAQHIVLQCGRYQIQWTADLRMLRALVFRVKSAIISPLYNLHELYDKEPDWTSLLYILESQMRQAARREGVVLQRNLLDVAFDFRHRRCTEPRDRYYAILAIIENEQGGSFNFDVDYSLSVDQVHERFRAAVQQVSEIEDVPLA